LREALALCDAVLDREPGHIGALDRAAKILVQGNDPNRALSYVTKIIALVPEAIGPFGTRAKICLALGQQKAAARIYRGLSRRHPVDHGSMIVIGVGLAQSGEAADAARIFDKIVHDAPQKPAGLEAANHLAVLAYQHGDLALARRTIEIAVRHHPARVELHQNLAVIRFELGEMEEAAHDAAIALMLEPNYAEAMSSAGQALFRHGIWPAATRLLRRAVRLNPDDVQAHLGVYYLAEAQGDHDLAAHHQYEALSRKQVFSEPSTKPDAPAILILEAPGDFQANLPIGFVLSNADFHLHRYVLVDGLPLRGPAELPHYDLVFNAISEPDRTAAQLLAAEKFIANQTKPVINRPDFVARTRRDIMAQMLAEVPDLIMPRAARTNRQALHDWIETGRPIDSRFGFPILVRPVGTHAGHNLERITNAEQLKTYLAELAGEDFYVTEFIDYSTPADGLFRKYRAILIDGIAYPFHMAVRDHWMVHYYNAHMELSASRRAEEEAFLADMAQDLGPRALAVFEKIGKIVDIDYFGIDFGLSPDGRVVLFEVDVAAIVHMMDDKEIYGYKHKYVPRVINAAKQLITDRLAAVS
jgi:tetratricopeptide (TPR) repeat protein/glutathione synthase/RimK-type ligase-like ATP-grasp enzyme